MPAHMHMTIIGDRILHADSVQSWDFASENERKEERKKETYESSSMSVRFLDVSLSARPVAVGGADLSGATFVVHY